MAKEVKDLLIISDLDNTLVSMKDGIAQYNIEMIDLFQKYGGKFTVATGRSANAVKPVLEHIKLNAPAITYNGGVIWDFEQDKFLHKSTMPNLARTVVQDILTNFSDVGCEIMAENFRIYVIRANEYTHKHLTYEKLNYINCDINNVNLNWIKVLFSADNKTLLKIQDYCKNLNIAELDFVMTNEIYFEIMPKGVTKATGLNLLCEKIGIDIQNTIFIGDYYNDVEILKVAGLSVCVDNAPDDIKAICKLHVPSCKDGGVGHLIRKILNTYNL